jgi:cysteine desulfuration protein SufE
LSIEERQKKYIDEFSAFQSWEDRYRHLIELGKKLPDLPAKLKTEEAKVKGCQSQVWLHAQINEKGEVEFQGDSDAVIVRGLVALLVQIYSFARPEEILATPPHFIKAIGFENNLSPSRTNGLYAMTKQIKNFALAFSMINKMKK